MMRSFHAVTLWIAMLLKRYNAVSRTRRGVRQPPKISVEAIETVIRNSVVMGIYMWDVVCMRLQARKFRIDVCHHSSSAIGDKDDGTHRFHNFGTRVRTERRHMCSRTYVDTWPEVSICNIVQEFSMGGVVKSEHVIPVRTDSYRADLDKRHEVVQLLDPNRNAREPRTIYDTVVMKEQGHLDKLYDWMCVSRRTNKFAFFVYNELPMNFVMFMLQWYSRIDGTDPHRDFVRAEPLFAFFYKQLSGRDFSAEVEFNDQQQWRPRHDGAADPKAVAKARVALSERASHLGSRQSKDDSRNRNDNGRSHGQEELIEFLRVMLQSIRVTEDDRKCRVCRTELVRVLTGSTSTTKAENNVLSRCPVAMCALSIKRRVQNMTKQIRKPDSAFMLEKSASPVLKQMLSLVSSIAKMRANGTPVGELRALTESARTPITYKHKAATDSLQERVDAVRSVEDMSDYTVYPFTVEELLHIDDVHSFVVHVSMASGALTHLSIHVLDPHVERKHSRFLVYTPFYHGVGSVTTSESSDNDLGASSGSRGRSVMAYVINGVKNMKTFWHLSPFNKVESSIVNVQAFRLSDRPVDVFCRKFPRVVATFVNSCKDGSHGDSY